MVILIGETEQIGKSIGNSSGVVAVFFINSRLITAGEKAELFHFFRSDVQVPCQKIAENTVAGLFTVIFNGGGAFLFFFRVAFISSSRMQNGIELVYAEKEKKTRENTDMRNLYICR